MAKESTNYAKYQILVQSGTSMLAQANQNPQYAAQAPAIGAWALIQDSTLGRPSGRPSERL